MKKETKVKSKTGRPLFRDGIHLCLWRFTDKQIDKDYKKWRENDDRFL